MITIGGVYKREKQCHDQGLICESKSPISHHLFGQNFINNIILTPVLRIGLRILNEANLGLAPSVLYLKLAFISLNPIPAIFA
jgi:hypothetical protein